MTDLDGTYDVEDIFSLAEARANGCVDSRGHVLPRLIEEMKADKAIRELISNKDKATWREEWRDEKKEAARQGRATATTRKRAYRRGPKVT